MLLELHRLAESLSRAGIAVPTQDPRFKSYGKKPVFLAFLNAAGQIERVSYLADNERLERLMKFEVSTGGSRPSTPGFNIPPLFSAKKGKPKSYKTLCEALGKANESTDRKRILSMIKRISLSPWDQKRDAITKCLQEAPVVLLQEVQSGIGLSASRVKSMVALLERIQTLDMDGLHRDLATILSRQIVQPEPYDHPESAIKLLLQEDGVLVFDLADPEQFDSYSAHHPDVVEAVEKAVHDCCVGRRGEAAYRGVFGEPVHDLATKLPEVPLQHLGNVKLRSLSKQKPCQFRYGRIEAETCPLGESLRDEFAAALRWISDTARRGRTWQDVSGACGYPSILLAYPERIPTEAPETASLFAPSNNGGDSEGARFEACAARVTAALEGIAREHPDVEVQVIVLLKRDNARTKVLVSEHYNARRLIEFAALWRDDARRIPRIALNVGTVERRAWITPLVPFPVELVECLNVAWLRGGERAKPTRAFAIGDGIALLTQGGPHAWPLVARALRLAVQNASPLLLAVGHADHRRDKPHKIPAKYAKHLRILPGILGLLLSKQTLAKGEFMETAAFWIGRMLALADTLHKEYCLHVRKKDLPPQLIGNAMMAIAMDRPSAGLARLGERLPVYQSWANTASGDGVGLAKWSLGEMGRVSEKLRYLLLPDPCDDVGKAQMLLGYLARSSSEKDAPPEGETEKEESNG